MIKLNAAGIHKRMGTMPVLKGVSASLNEGEVVALIGHSGSGKTTLLRSIAGLETPDSGTIALEGKTIFDAARRINLPPEQRGLGFVFQSYALWPHRTVVENVGYGLKLRGVSKADIDSRTRDVLDRLGLGKLGQRYPHQLSGGQQQRVALARALAYRPPVLLLDEPLSNLDAKLRVAMRTEIKELHQRLKTTTVYVTHDQIEAMTMADKIVVMHDGIVEQIGSPLVLYDRPDNQFVAGFIGSPAMNFLSGHLVSNGQPYVMTDNGSRLPLAAAPTASEGRPIVYGVRPEHLELAGDGIEAEVVVVEPTGSETQIVARIGSQDIIAVFRDRHSVSPGETIHLRPRAAAAHLFDKDTGERI